MDVTVEVTESGDQLRSLATWLDAEDELRGRVRLALLPVVPGTLGAVSDVLVIALGAGGAGTVLAGALVAWLRQPKSDVVCKLSRSDGTSFEVSSTNVRGADAVMIRELVAELSTRLTESSSIGPGEEDRAGVE